MQTLQVVFAAMLIAALFFRFVYPPLKRTKQSISARTRTRVWRMRRHERKPTLKQVKNQWKRSRI